jgi:hypothetical protein
MRTRILAVLIVLGTTAAPALAEAKAPRLKAFASCDQMLGFARAHAATMVGTGWTPQVAGPGRVIAQPLPATQEDTGTAPQQQSVAGAPAAPDVSDTNLQEAGVDEPDVIKTDGKRAYAVANGVLHVVDVRSDPPRLLGSLKLQEGSGHELLLHGSRLLVLQNAFLAGEQPQPQPVARPSRSLVPVFGRPVARLTEVDVSDPAAPAIVRADRVDGSYVTARRTGDVARVVISSPAQALETATQAKTITGRRAAVRKARLASWRPRAFSRDRAKHRNALYPIVPCRQVRHPATFAGLDTVTVLTVDLDKGLPAVDADAVMSDAETVYGSPSRLYVASSRWLAPQVTDDARPPPATTQIHAFDVSHPDHTDYTGTGSVSGFLLNQFSLSEHDGRLRVASTDTPQWWGTQPPAGQSESFMTVLDAASLTEVGKVGGIGGGEQIYAVRFIDDLGYVVTFKRVDPLHVVDLSAPANPRVVGELQIEGYSAYLHPVGKDLLLGVGQDATADGRAKGTQLSLFDVSDPAKPTRIAAKALGSDSNSSVEFDHKAFLWWGPKDLAVVPVSVYDSTGAGQPFLGAVGFGVTREAITERGRIQHPFASNPVEVTRSLVVGDRLFTLSDSGLLASDLVTLKPGPWVPFPDGPGQR